jgi:hypothetical protein
MQFTITGTLEEIRAVISFPTTMNARVTDPIGTAPTPGTGPSVGAALAEFVKSQTGNNRKFLDFLIRKGKVPQSGETVAAELSIQVLQLNGNIGALNNKSAKLTGQPIIDKKKRGRKMYYTINPLVLAHK